MEISEAKRLKSLEKENAELKKMLAEAMLDIRVLKEIMWIQLLSAPFAVREKTKANRYISFVYSSAPRRGAYEGVYSVDPASKVRNIDVTQSRPGSHADGPDRRCASHDDFTRIKTKPKPQRILPPGRSSTQPKTKGRP
jgi:hypothetical protein